MATVELTKATTAMRQITPMPGAQEISFFFKSNFINFIKEEKNCSWQWREWYFVR